MREPGLDLLSNLLLDNYYTARAYSNRKSIPNVKYMYTYRTVHICTAGDYPNFLSIWACVF